MTAAPSVIVFDVNETLSDTSALGRRFADVGAPESLAATWFAQLLRDGFALTATGEAAGFAAIAASLLDEHLGGLDLDRPLDEAKAHVLGSFGSLPLHPDVAPGLQALTEAGLRVVTLSNGSTQVAASLFEAAGVADRFERLLSVADAPVWKPGADAYRWAGEQLNVAPNEMMLVAVHPWDIHGATRAGLRTAWITRTGSAYPSYFAPAELVVSSVTDLASRLG